MSISNQKLVADHTFVEGIKTIIANELTPPTTAKYILNCNILSQGEGSVGIITNVKGNVLISTPLPLGENECIGTAADEETNKFYFFVWNANGFHSIQQFDALSRVVTTVLENLTDTGNLDIMKLDKDYLILHADVVRNNLLYWVDGLNPARKTNINKLFDNSSTGYGLTILQSFIDAYKQTTPLPPTAIYFSDTSRPFNRLYGALRKFAVRLIYDDGEKSNVSDFSAVALPSYEPFTGVNTIPTDNNGINITFTTGDRTVKHIEIFVQSTINETNNEALSAWGKIATLDKRKMNIADDSSYTYSYYNDTAPIATDQQKIYRPYSFLPKRPLCQSFVKNALVYANAYEGFPTVDIDTEVTVTYEDLFLDAGVENEFNEPVITITSNDTDYLEIGTVTRYNGSIENFVVPKARRFNRQTVTIGADVKKGNIFYIFLSNGFSGDNFTLSYEANNTDSSLTVANQLKNQLIATGRIYRKTPDMPDTNIYDNTIVAGNVSFSFLLRASDGKNYINGSASVNPVQFDTLKDTGQSIRNIKLGSSIKLGIMYEDFDGRKSLVYTEEALIVNIKTINTLILDDGKTMYQSPVITLQINHIPPVWAKYYQIVRSADLVYGDYIQLLIQKVIDFNNEDEQDYLDLAVGSLFTYQKIHPNTPLAYEFTKGDRLRLLKNTEDDTYYPFFETEIIAYNPTVTQNLTSNLVTNGTATVTVAETNVDDIGKFILVDGVEREIVSVPSGTTYLLNNVIGDSTPKTYLNYDLIDRRGSIRIRRPNDITIEDNSIVELYKPSNLSNPLGSAQFYEFQKKFPIIGAGTTERYHTGNIQGQTALLPALIEISEGTAYVRNREMPVNNAFPGTQLVIEVIEDPSYSDFYPSLINDNGRINVEDNGDGEVHFGSRMRYSNNFIEDTRINGLNDFDNLDREDYNDKYGDFKLCVFDTNRIFGFKKLKTTFVSVDSVITQDNNGLALNVNSAKLLNPIQYFAWEGGIGDNPESYASNGTHKYFVSANSGVIIRLGGNGEEPISKTYSLDNEVKALLNDAINNKAKIFGGFDRKNGVYVITIEGYNKYIYFDGFNGWIINDTILPEDTLFEIVDMPLHGTATLSSGFEITYQPELDYVGADSFTYRAFIDGVWSEPKKACITVVEPPVVLGWRPKAIPFTCVLDQYGLQTGYKLPDILEQYNLVTGEATGVEKPNVIGDPNYSPAVYAPTDCVPEPVDDIPNPFTFTPVINAELNTLYTSDVATITGINVSIPVGVTDGEYRINGGAWITTPSTVVNGDTLETRRNSSPSYSTLVSSSVTAGGVTGTYNITTKDNLVPDPFTFVDVTNAEVSTVYESNIVTITGITGASPITMVGGEYRIDGGAWTSAAGTINNDQTLQVRQTSDASYEITTNATPTVGGYSDTYSVTTKVQPDVGNEYRSGVYRRNDCPVGSTGTLYTTEVFPDTYFADTLAEANALADAYIAANGQTNANNPANGFCILDDVSSIVVVDLTDNTLDVYAYIDTVGVSESGSGASPLNIAARDGMNFFLTTDVASQAFMLASDNMPGDGGIYRRFEFNVGKLIGMYPDAVAIPEFIFKIAGRKAGSAAGIGGFYTLKYPDQNMIMNGSPGTYIPSVVPPGGPTPNPFTTNVTGGGDGTVGWGIGALILTITYNRAANTVSITTIP